MNELKERLCLLSSRLFDIKRSLIDSEDMINKEKLKHLRVSIHYLIAYLTTLIHEYQKEYSNISHKQSYQEAVKNVLKNEYAKKVADAMPIKKVSN